MQLINHDFHAQALDRMHRFGFLQMVAPGSRYAPEPGTSASGLRLKQVKDEYRQERCQNSDQPLVSVVTVVKDDIEGLEQTINSLQTQDYTNIEHIVIDGCSRHSIDILDLCARRGIALAISERDHGIYDAMNKGICLAQGDYICLLNAGDTYNSRFIGQGVKALTKSQAALGLSYGGLVGVPTAKEWSHGILIHHLNINHQAFMVSSATYRAVGGYSTLYKVVSDIAWARAAFLMDVEAVYVGDDMLRFAPGGLSSSSKYRELIKWENAELTRSIFGTISLGQAQEIYEFRFRPTLADAVHQTVETGDIPLKLSISSATRYLLNAKHILLNSSNINESFVGLFRLCTLLEIEHSKICFDNSPNSFNRACEAIESFLSVVDSNPAKACLLHYLEVFNRASETFVYHLIKRNEEFGYAHNLILCDNRELKDIRPHPHVICVPWNSMHPLLREAIYLLLLRIRWKCIVCHFALNSEKFLLRLHRYQWGNYRFIHMMHGIDVFLLRDNSRSNYKSLIVEHVSQLANHSFTTPSKFLKARAGLEGIPLRKISIVHNCANNIFHKHRKISDYYLPGKSKRKLKILTVGRLIGWKNHARLISAFAQAKELLLAPITLTIVYGNDATELDALTNLIKQLDLEEHITLTKFVNFEEDPGYFSRYDLFIMPSTYSEDTTRKTETFGVATLEAIAAGLPVLISNAGASQEIVEGKLGTHAQIFTHDNVDDLRDKIITMVNNGKCFSDNSSLANPILSKFSESRQLDQFWNAIERFPEKTINVLQVSADATGGAGGAAWRCHRGLRKAGVNSIFLCRRFSGLPSEAISTELIVWNDTQSARYNHRQPPAPFQLKPGNSIFSVDEEHFTSRQLEEIIYGFNIIHLNWVARFLTTENIAYITTQKLTLFTVRDMQPITGGCHYLHGCNKFEGDCAPPCPQLDHRHRSLPNQVMHAKTATWNLSNLTFIGISKITASIIKRSKLGSLVACVRTIQNGFTNDYMRYYDKDTAKDALGLDSSQRYILFMPSYSSTVKGADLAARALLSLYQQGMLTRCSVLIAGKTEENALNIGGVPTQRLGFIHDNSKLNLLYSASEITLLPSIEETFSNTCAEAMLSGSPVVGYSSGAIPEMIIDQHTGVLARDFSYESLASAISKALETDWDREWIRGSLLHRFSLRRNTEAHISIYRELMSNTRETSKEDPYLSLRSIERFGLLTKNREILKVLTSTNQLTTKNILVSGCKNATMWISESGHLCFTLSTFTPRHFIWQGPKDDPITSSKPIKAIEITGQLLAPRAYSGQLMPPLYRSTNGEDLTANYVTISRDLTISVRSKLNDELVATIDLRRFFTMITDSSLLSQIT